MATPSAECACCSCGSSRIDRITGLGSQPDPDWLLGPTDPGPAPEAPVELAICADCGLLQLTGPRPAGPRPAHGHAMPVHDGDPWAELVKQSVNWRTPVVLDVDGSSGLSEYVRPAGVVVHSGIDATAPDLASLILVGHALNHADDIASLLVDIDAALAPDGLIAVDFHHALGIARGQFDVIAHTHRSYLTLLSLEHVLSLHGFAVVAASRIDEYGGTIRALAARRSDDVEFDGIASDVEHIRASERTARVDRAEGFDTLEKQIGDACAGLVGFLDDVRRSGRTVAGYGAAARGTTLLNLAGVGVDELPFIVDRSAAKQGRLLPRALIPVRDPSALETDVPDDILVLPWPLSEQISEQLSSLRNHGSRFVVAVPRLEFLPSVNVRS